MAELVEIAAVPEARTIGLDQDQAHAARAAVRLVLTTTITDRMLAVGDEGLLARNNVLVAVANRTGSDALQSLPVPGSVMAIAQTVWPAIMRGSRHASAPRCRSSAGSRSRRSL